MLRGFAKKIESHRKQKSQTTKTQQQRFEEICKTTQNSRYYYLIHDILHCRDYL